MDDSQASSLEQIRALVNADSAVRFTGQRREEIYAWVEKTLVRHEYASLRKPDKGVLRQYIALLTILEALLEQFPFVIRGFHSDNGSEFINYTVARLLDKLLIEQTKSRAYHSGDNGLVECKNGAIIRKHIGYGYIGQQHAQAVDRFHREHLNPYVNFHRPCAVPTVITAANGKRRRIYLRWATPFELLQESPHSRLRPGITLAELQRFARSQSDTEAALAMQRAKRKLLDQVKGEQTA
jgi:hypothetical protein